MRKALFSLIMVAGLLTALLPNTSFAKEQAITSLLAAKSDQQLLPSSPTKPLGSDPQSPIKKDTKPTKPKKGDQGLDAIRIERPLSLSLQQSGSRTYLKIKPVAPQRVEIYAGKTRLKSFAGAGKDRFNITALIPKAYKNKLTAHAYAESGRRYTKVFDISKQLARLKPIADEAKGTKQLAPGITDDRKKGAVEPKLKPLVASPLSITRIYYADHSIHVALNARAGLGRMDHKKIRLHLKSVSHDKSWPLSKIIPFSRMQTLKGSVDFDTGLSLKQAESVRIELKNIKPPISQQAFLKPPAIVASKKPGIKPTLDEGTSKGKKPDALLDTSKEKGRGVFGKMVLKSRQQKDRPQERMRAPVDLDDIIAEFDVDYDTTTTSYDGGINIDPIDEITTRWFILSYGVNHALENGDIRFALLRGGERVAETTRRFEHGGGDPALEVYITQRFTWTLPVDLVNGDNYGIIASKSDAVGFSDTFSINIPERSYGTGVGMTLEITSPDGSAFLHGDELTLRIASTCGDTIGDVSLQLVSGAAPVRDLVTLDGGSVFRSTHHSWTIPADIPSGEYRLLARAGVSDCSGIDTPSAYTRVFTISPPFEDPSSVVVDSPDAGDVIYTGSVAELWAMWRCVECWYPDELSYTRVLLKDGVELQRIGPYHAGGDMNPSDWFNIFGYLSGPDYQVRIELNRWNVASGRAEMIAVDTSDNFTIINNFTGYHADTNPVFLNLPTGSGGASFAIGSTLEIMWSHDPPTSDRSVRLTLTRDSTEGGGEWPIASRLPASEFIYEWVIPSEVPPGPGYRVLVERTDGAGSSNSGIPFTITP